jgi:opacity protein-like surface antigen
MDTVLQKSKDRPRGAGRAGSRREHPHQPTPFNSMMKRNVLLTAVSAAVLAATSFAGETTYAPSKGVVPPAPVYYGTGFYLGLQAGINAYQDFGGTRRFDVGDNEISLEPREKIGFVGGVKAGYVFGTSTVRPAIEADLYYNGVEADLDARANGNDLDFNADAKLHSGAFMGNFLVRFAFDRFQPYLGGGLGGYYAEASDAEVTIGGRTREVSTGSTSGFAWQLIGGADYYFTEKFSAFLEYKFLNYEDAGVNDDRLSQHLVVLGLRWHF